MQTLDTRLQPRHARIFQSFQLRITDVGFYFVEEREFFRGCGERRQHVVEILEVENVVYDEEPRHVVFTRQVQKL